MIHPVLSELASELYFEVHGTSIFGRFKGIPLSITQSDLNIRHYSVAINLAHLSDAQQIAVKESLSKPKPKRMISAHLDTITDCLTLLLSHPLFDKDNYYRASCRTLIDRIAEVVPPGPEGRLFFFNGLPLFENQIASMREEVSRQEKSLSYRSLTSLGAGILSAIAANALTYLFPKFSGFTSGPLAFFAVGAIAAGRFTRGVGFRTTLRVDAATLSAILLAVVVFQMIGVAVALIPPGYRRSPELVHLAFNNWLTSGFQALILWVATLVLSLYALAHAKPKTSSESQLAVAHDPELSAAYYRGSRKILKFFFASMLLGFVSVFIAVFSHRSSVDFESSTPFIIAAISCHLAFVGLLLAWLHRNKDLQITTTHLGSRRFAWMIIPSALFVPAFLTVGALPWIMVANEVLDSSPTETRIGKVGRLRAPEVTRAVCWPVNDPSSGAFLGIFACERDHGRLRGGETMTYSYKKGWLKTGLLFNKHIDRPDTWEKLFVEVGSPAAVRSIDVEHLVTIPSERTKLTESLLPKWKRLCAEDRGEFCRLNAYLVDPKKHPDDYAQLLKQGCQAGDYKSCFGLLLLNPKDSEAMREHGKRSFSACTSGQIEACEEFVFYWKQGDSPEKRVELVQALERLCQNGNQNACEKVIWERNRI